MLEAFYDRINDYGAVTIKLASPRDIRDWSYGEVKKPETINYRTHRPEKDGLFCERIFGPERDWECYCGRYRGMKHKGIVCDRCGVKIAHSRVRRKRMGHINLASPVAHIWFFKATPSHISVLLNVKTTALEKVIYFQEYIVVEPGNTGLKKCELMTEEKFREYQFRYGAGSFQAGMGAEAVQKLLQSIEMESLIEDLQKEYKKTGSKQKQKDIIKRLKLAKTIYDSGNKPEWMVLDVIPVIPPELRPLLMLDTGTFATSDLNDLYRRLINRNNRLKRLMDMNAPEVIIRNEKRMLQQSVDALFDNSRCKRPVIGTGNRPLKSLTEMIKGKQGRFRENLLGKRVDYSGRSVIVVGPELRLHQCGIPKKIALELFQPFIIRKLKDLGHAETIKNAKKMLEKKDDRVWDILEEVIHDHPVMLNRAPTLHRMGIQAFYPILTEGNAIKIHPLVCTGFNADFDGDQMAVHLPLSIEAQIEAATLMLSINNIFSPASGQPIIAPSQDIVLGCYYLTQDKVGKKGEGSIMGSYEEVLLARSHGKVTLHTFIWYRMLKDRIITPPLPEDSIRSNGKLFKTTVGRIIFNRILPPGMPFYNEPLDKKKLNGIISTCHELLGRAATIELLDSIKELGFRAATWAGISIAKDNLVVPPEKERIVREAEAEVLRVVAGFEGGSITSQEKSRKVVDCWTQAREAVGAVMMNSLQQDQGIDGKSFNPLYLMASSGARGSKEQIRQLAGMRGLMAKPSGAIIETPIIANFREGLKVLEYFSSTHGARKGLADTALKTADAGYLTRKLADVAQNIVINEHDCGTADGIPKGPVRQNNKAIVPLWQNIRGRTSRNTIVNPQTGEVIVQEGELITVEIAKKIEALGRDKIWVRSPLTCKTPVGICAKCYGMDLSTGRLVEQGMAVGIIAAQSIGEPGTQLTMRTFHIGGIAMKTQEENQIKVIIVAGTKVLIKFQNIKIALNKKKEHVVTSQHGSLSFLHEETVVVPSGATLKVVVGQQVVLTTVSETVAINKTNNQIKSQMGGTVKMIEGKVDPETMRTLEECRVVIQRTEETELPLGSILLPIPEIGGIASDGVSLSGSKSDKTYVIATIDRSNRPIISEVDGIVYYEDIIPDVTVKKERQGKVIIEHKGEHHPQLIVKAQDGSTLQVYSLNEKSHIIVEDGETITAGTLLAKTPCGTSENSDITGGLPRVTELLEARRPKNPAVLSEIEGEVILGEKRRGKRVVIIENKKNGIKKEHLVPHSKLKVHTGDMVKAGDALVEGAKVPHDILRHCQGKGLQEYLLEEIQNVYRSQNVTIDDKHIEIIIAQMMRKVKVEKSGDTEFLPGTIVDRFKFLEVNGRAISEGKKTAIQKPLLLGITKASLQSDSFISAASFQETTKVLTEAALAGKKDDLIGLKENVILGHMIPAGTGFWKHFRTLSSFQEDTESHT